MSKSLGNYIGINEDPKDQFGKVHVYFRRAYVSAITRLLTESPLAEIQTLRREMASGKRHPMEIKGDLAVRIITDYHGADDANAAREEFNRIFTKREIPEDIETKEISLGSGPMRLSKLMASVNLAPSVTEAQRLIESGAVHMNDQRITDVKAEISAPGEYFFQGGSGASFGCSSTVESRARG